MKGAICGILALALAFSAVNLIMNFTETQKQSVWKGKTFRVPIPKTRDPFVNTPLLSVGRDAHGEERFWISSYNPNGCLAVLITESGDYRIYRFGNSRHAGFYSAAVEDENTLWLCGDLSRVVRFRLDTGKFEEFATGAPSALVFQGMVLDHHTGKLFAAAFPISKQPHTTAFSFDFRRRQPVKAHHHVCADDKYMRFSFPNGDGSYSCVLHVPGETLVRWDPRSENITSIPIVDAYRKEGATTCSLIANDEGCWYIPQRGWYDPRTQRFTPGGPRPQREMTWFARHGQHAWGGDSRNGNVEIGLWDLASGQVRSLGSIRDCSISNIRMTASGKIIAVNLYGEFFRFDGKTGALEMSKRLPTDAIGHVDCLCRMDRERLLGTTFITQQFWEVNLRTRQGHDCGRAAPGFGEVALIRKLGRKIYMAVYSGAELMEYDPARPAGFPENPRVVAVAPGGMRPRAATDDGRHLFYACSNKYGNLGSVLTRYDVKTGAVLHRQNPLPDQQIESLCYDRPTNSLLCGTTMHADQQSCPSKADRCVFAIISADDLSVQKQTPAPSGVNNARVVGPLGRGRYLATCYGDFDGGRPRWFTLDMASFSVPPLAATDTPQLPAGSPRLITDPTFAGRPGYFVIQTGERLELWDMRKPQCIRILCPKYQGDRFIVQDDSVYIVEKETITVLEDCLR